MAEVTWIDTTPPTATISYTPDTITNGTVTATWIWSESVTPINTASTQQVFSGNGSFTMYVMDSA